MTDRFRFGIFMAPFHPAGENPTRAIERDLQLIQLLDRLGWDEAWIGEHHSAGTEIIASPEVFIAAAAERTRHIRLGTGVISVAYHNPFMVAERAVQLDHMTRGRFMLGLGPGSLPTDAIMVGLDPTETRPLLEDGVDVILRLLSSDEAVTSHEGVDDHRCAPAPAPVLLAAVRGCSPGRRLAVGAAPRWPVRSRAVVDRCHPVSRIRRSRAALGRDGGAGGDVRHGDRPLPLAPRGADTHRRDP